MILFSPPQGTKVPTHKPDPPFDMALYNSFGSIGQVCDNSPSDVIQRSSNFCGIETTMRLASAKTMVNCFMNSSKLRDWDLCLEINVHGELHSLHGGAYDCPADLKALSDENPERFPLKVMDFIGVGLFNTWYKEVHNLGVFNCLQKEDDGWPCARDDAACGDTNLAVSFTNKDVSDEELWTTYTNTVLGFSLGTQYGEGFIEVIDTDLDNELAELGAKYKFKHLPPSEQTSFARWLMAFGSVPGKTGIASSGAAPADPLFWAWHSIFDKMLHALRLSPHFTETFDMTWVASEGEGPCGAHWEDHFPFEVSHSPLSGAPLCGVASSSFFKTTPP